MTETLEETYGQLLLSQLFTHIWFGNWEEYELTIDKLPVHLREEFPFHEHYNRDVNELWYENHFNIPGVYFIPPYISSYGEKTEEAANESRQDLLCLIGTFDKLGFYYPLEQNEFPDHIGSLTAFITAALAEEAKALEKDDQQLVRDLRDSQEEMYFTYIKPNIKKMWKHNKRKFVDPFFKQFIPFYIDSMEEIINNKKCK